MKVVFTHKENGKLTWESPRDLDRAVRAAGVKPSERASTVHDMMASTADIFSALMLALSYGIPGTPREKVAFLEEIDGDIRRLVQNYLDYHGE